MPRTQAQNTRDSRLKREHVLIERLAIEAGYTVKGNDKSGIDAFLDDVENKDTGIDAYIINGVIVDYCETCKKKTKITVSEHYRPECNECESDPYDTGYEDDGSGVPF